MSAARAIGLWRASAAVLRLRVAPVALNTARKSLRPRVVPQVVACSQFTTASWQCQADQTAAEPSKEEYLPDPSLDSPDPSADYNRTQILDEALKLVPALGWSGAVLTESIASLGLSGVVDEGEMFPRGPGHLVDHFEQQCNQSLGDVMEKLANEDKLDGSRLVRAAVEQRLRMLSPYIEKWPQAMAVKALPPNIPSVLETLALMVDDIWYMAGDKSTDINWYTKRALLASLYTSTELYMVQDRSPDFNDTWDFLQTRISDIKDLNKIYDELGGLAKGAFQFINAGISTARNMAGWNDKQR